MHLGLVALLAGSSSTIAQETGSDSDDSVFELSPFEVDGSQDQGYLAANSLAGSRLNTSLKDISAVIDVYTSEFIDDMAATDLQEPHSITGFVDCPQPEEETTLSMDLHSIVTMSNGLMNPGDQTLSYSVSDPRVESSIIPQSGLISAKSWDAWKFREELKSKGAIPWIIIKS
jgi:hypothetical protein